MRHHARLLLFVPVLLSGYALAGGSPLDAIAIGRTVEEIRAMAGSQYLEVGGPESRASQHFELSGPLAKSISGSEDRPLYLVFARDREGSAYLLIYAHWRMSSEQEAYLLPKTQSFPRSKMESPTRCLRAGEHGLLGLRNSPSTWEREAVLESSPGFLASRGIRGGQARPQYKEVCRNGPQQESA